MPTIKAEHVILAESILFSICGLQVTSNNIYCFSSKSECLYKLSFDMGSTNHEERLVKYVIMFQNTAIENNILKK